MSKKLKYMCFLKNKYYFKKSVCFIFIYSIFAHCFHIILKPTSIKSSIYRYIYTCISFTPILKTSYVFNIKVYCENKKIENVYIKMKKIVS